MRKMSITIEGAKITPSWMTLQQMLNESLKDEGGKLVRITRKDDCCDYRGTGEYELEYHAQNPVPGFIVIDYVVK